MEQRIKDMVLYGNADFIFMSRSKNLTKLIELLARTVSGNLLDIEKFLIFGKRFAVTYGIRYSPSPDNIDPPFTFADFCVEFILFIILTKDEEFYDASCAFLNKYKLLGIFG